MRSADNIIATHLLNINNGSFDKHILVSNSQTRLQQGLLEENSNLSNAAWKTMSYHLNNIASK